MVYNYGDKITLENLGTFIVLDTCVYNDYEYMIVIEDNQESMIMVEVKDEDNMRILKDPDLIQKILEQMKK